MIWIVEALFAGGGKQEVARFTDRKQWRYFMNNNQGCKLFPDRACVLVTREVLHPSPEDYPVALRPSDVDLDKLPF